VKLITELKRRKVFKVGAAYLVVAWVLIQVVATLAPQFQLPDWAPRLVTLILLIGFPIAVVMAWMFDITPEGVVRDPADAVAAQLTTPAAGTPPIAMAAAIPHKSIAVLPFVDLSPTHDQEYFSDGIAEEILNALVKLKDLKVAGRTSSFSFKGRNEDLRGIGKALAVAHVLEGSVRKHGDKVRITAQLIQVEDGYHLWSDSYDGDLSDVFELQERIARAITRELDVILHGDPQQRLVPVATTSPEAYGLYLQASGIFNRRDGVRFPEAIAQLHKALELDPNFARAHARLAAIHGLEPIYVPNSSAAATVAAEHEAALAIALDPSLAEPHAALSMTHIRLRRYIDAFAALERALAIDADDITANFWGAIAFLITGYTARGCAHLDRALALDPLLPNALFWRGVQYFYARDVERAETLMRHAADVGLTHAGLGLHLALAARGRIAEAKEQLAAGLGVLGAGLPADMSNIIASGVYGDEAARTRALTVIDDYLATQPQWLSGNLPYALILLGEPRRMLLLSMQHGSNNDAACFHSLWGPQARAMRALPEFAEFARQVGMVAVWDRYGPPDGCHKNAAGDYVFD
jgi:TolB-like protein